MQHKRAVLLLSGGLDSTTLLALAASEGYAVHALSFDYGQRHSAELIGGGEGCQAIWGRPASIR